MTLRSIAKTICPTPIWNSIGGARRVWVSRNDHKLSTEQVFSQIYKKRLWSGDEKYSSGDGSRETSVVDPYIQSIEKWAHDHNGSSMNAVDLGCGDFHIGRKLFHLFKSYTGMEIVSELVELHNANHQAPGLSFIQGNAISDPLPSGDILFIRQVLQHLSNTQIQSIISKISAFRWALITEHHPSEGYYKTKNLDKPHGGGIRNATGSGVYLLEPPFSLKCVDSYTVLDVAASENPKDGRIVTTCYRFQ